MTKYHIYEEFIETKRMRQEDLKENEQINSYVIASGCGPLRKDDHPRDYPSLEWLSFKSFIHNRKWNKFQYTPNFRPH